MSKLKIGNLGQETPVMVFDVESIGLHGESILAPIPWPKQQLSSGYKNTSNFQTYRDYKAGLSALALKAELKCNPNT